MIEFEWAGREAAAWIDAWNRKDLEAILSHYAEEAVFYSPTVIERMGIPDGKIVGKALLRTHFAKGLDSFQEVRFGSGCWTYWWAPTPLQSSIRGRVAPQ